MVKIAYHLANIFGFTATGRSLLGKHYRRLFGHSRVKRWLGVFLISLGLLDLVSPAFANIGGGVSVNLESPQVSVDAYTKQTAQLPLHYSYESRGFSWFHSGVDLVAPTGTPVKPIMPGEVKESDPNYFGYGNYVVVTHDKNYESLYAHLSQIEVKPGQKVDLNTELGKSGSTGFSTGPHLHLEVHYNGQAIDPKEVISGIQ